MRPLEEVLYDLIVPFVEQRESLSVKHLPSLDEREIVLAVYAESADTARLIGKGGSMAYAIRQSMAIASRALDKRVTVSFESY